MLTLNELSHHLSQPCQRDGDIREYSIDTRTLQPGDVFVALPGARVNGHRYILEAEKKGAIAVLCQQPLAKAKIPQLVVPNALQALGEIAKIHRQRFQCPVLALTGSNGKTTVKEMIVKCLPPSALATQGNLNNHIGLPLMVLRMRNTHPYAVFELGANHPGEIAHTARVCKPNVALINNIGPAHIEGFGSIEGVAKAKGEIFDALPKRGVAIINEDDQYHRFWDNALQDKTTFRFSLQSISDCHASEIDWDKHGCASFMLHLPKSDPLPIQLSVPGQHNVANALAAASCCWNLGIEPNLIAHGLRSFVGVPGRQSVKLGINEARIIDDSYNANLRSTLAAIEVLARYPGNRILVMGDMGELGDDSLLYHQEIGLAAQDAGINAVYTVGAFAKAASQKFHTGESLHFKNKTDLVHYIKPQLNKNTTILIKGSRSAAMETIVHAITTEPTLQKG